MQKLTLTLVALALPSAALAAPPAPWVESWYGALHAGDFARVADADGDGDADFASGGYWGCSTSKQTALGVFTNDFNGPWGGQQGSRCNFMQADDDPELEPYWRALGLLQVTDTPGFTWNTAGSLLRESHGDYDGNGYDDFLTGVTGGGFRLVLNDGARTFNDGWSGLTANSGGLEFLSEPIDLYGDGTLYVAAGRNNQKFTLLRTGTDGSQTIMEVAWESSTAHDIRNVQFGDVDGDGDQDMVTLDYTVAEAYLGLWLNDGGASFTDGGAINLGTVDATYHFDVGNFDFDAKAELATFQNGATEPPRIHEFNGTTWDLEWTGSTSTVYDSIHGLGFVDLDMDGTLELALYGPRDTPVYGRDGDFDDIADWHDPCPTGDDSLDADSDGVADECDVCDGDDATGDTDADGICNNIDICDGDDAVDSDSDSVPDACDVCAGDDATGDTDSDGVCDDIDICDGDDAVDADSDSVPDACDVCDGDDATGDTDADGVCDDTDVCDGDDATGDTDADGVCDDTDVCDGDDGVDADGNGTPDDCDIDEEPDTAGDADPEGCGCASGGAPFGGAGAGLIALLALTRRRK